MAASSSSKGAGQVNSNKKLPVAMGARLPGLKGFQKSLVSFFLPNGDSQGAFSPVSDIRNMADGMGTTFSNSIYRRNNNTNQLKPTVLRDNLGPYWWFSGSTTRLALSAGDTNVIPWRTGSGWAAGTIGLVFRFESLPGAQQTLFNIGGATGSECNIAIETNASNQVTGFVSTFNTATCTGPTMVAGRPYAAIFTTRSRTDHELVVRDLITGSVTSGTSVTDSGASTGQSSSWFFGSLANLGRFALNVRFYMGAFWNQSFTNAEMQEWSRLPFGSLVPDPSAADLQLATALSASFRARQFVLA